MTVLAGMLGASRQGMLVRLTSISIGGFISASIPSSRCACASGAAGEAAPVGGGSAGGVPQPIRVMVRFSEAACPAA